MKMQPMKLKLSCDVLAPIVPPPSAQQLHEIELSVLARQSTFREQASQTDVPRIPAIPLPPIPRQAIEPEIESGEYECVRDSNFADTMFEMPEEVHSWQARLFGYPTPNNDQFYNISYVTISDE